MLKLFHTKGMVEAGCDEAGRGCLAGPVYAAAVILDPLNPIPGLDDSKKLSRKKREELRICIEQNVRAYGVARVEAEEIDEINILNASYLAMHRALEKLKVRPDQLLIDGNRFNPWEDVPFHCIVKGDGKFSAIAAASILAKTYRDEYMTKLSGDYPEYKWEKNAGYPTIQHRQAIKKLGATPHHRKSFRLLNEQLEIPFC